jgi:hypothetical protein
LFSHNITPLHGQVGNPTKRPTPLPTTRYPTRQPTENPTRDPTNEPTVGVTSNATEIANATVDNLQSGDNTGQEKSTPLNKDQSGTVVPLSFVAWKWYSALYSLLSLLL